MKTVTTQKPSLSVVRRTWDWPWVWVQDSCYDIVMILVLLCLWHETSSPQRNHSDSTLFWSQSWFKLDPFLFLVLFRTQPSSVLCFDLDLTLFCSVLIWTRPLSQSWFVLDLLLVWSLNSDSTLFGSRSWFKLDPFLVSDLFRTQPSSVISLDSYSTFCSILIWTWPLSWSWFVLNPCLS